MNERARDHLQTHDHRDPGERPGGVEIAHEAERKRSYSRPVFMWEEPPGFVRESVYKDALMRLKLRPGKWARIINADYSVVAQCAGNMRNSAIVQREGPFEIASRKLGPGIGAVYARYIGEPETWPEDDV